MRYGFRDYEPATGRWTARDPILFEGGQGNLNVYVGNSPPMYRDANGLDAIVSQYPGVLGFGHVGIGVNTNETLGFYPSETVPGSAVLANGVLYLAIQARQGLNCSEKCKNKNHA